MIGQYRYVTWGHILEGETCLLKQQETLYTKMPDHLILPDGSTYLKTDAGKMSCLRWQLIKMRMAGLDMPLSLIAGILILRHSDMGGN